MLCITSATCAHSHRLTTRAGNNGPAQASNNLGEDPGHGLGHDPDLALAHELGVGGDIYTSGPNPSSAVPGLHSVAFG
jgi:hypothetical protein